MTAEQTELAKRLAAHPKFEWQDRMQRMWVFGGKWQNVSRCVKGHDCIPSLTDWATIGCLLGMLVDVEMAADYPNDKRSASDRHFDALDMRLMRAMSDGALLSEGVALALLAAWGEP